MGFNIKNNDDVMPEINITPFVDVLLILLVIFMISTPAIMSGISVDLPNGTKDNGVNLNQNATTVTIDANGKVFVDDIEYGFHEVADVIKNKAGSNFEQTIFLRSDGVIQYKYVMELVRQLGEAGYKKVVLVTKDANSN